MSNILWLRDLSIVECALCFGVLGIMVYKRQLRAYTALMGLLAVRALSGSILIPLLFFRKATGLGIETAYDIYFFTNWISAGLQAILLVATIYDVYSKAMQPLKGLQKIGKVIFRWVAVVSVAVSVAIAVGPHLSTPKFAGTITTAVTQVQQGTFVLTLCLLLFVCFAIRPLGLTYRSHVFGVTLGLGVTASAFLVQAAWISTLGAQSLYSPIYLVSTVGSLLSVCVWGSYFILPEPARKMILLPTTSPFFTWNRISEALGDEPGYVVVAGFKPEMLAAAELKVLSSPAKTDRLAAPPAVGPEQVPRASLQQIAVSQ